jgi:hypothetical protein
MDGAPPALAGGVTDEDIGSGRWLDLINIDFFGPNLLSYLELDYELHRLLMDVCLQDFTDCRSYLRNR